MKRREEVVRAGVRVMRKKGALGMRLQDLAEHLRVAYTALYYYFESRDDLVEAVLLWVLEQRRCSLMEAAGESALDRLLHFFCRYLTEDGDHKVRLPFLGGFAEPHRGRIASAHGSFVDELIALLRHGMAEGSIRRCHAPTIAQVLTNYLDRFVEFDEGLTAHARTLSTEEVVRGINGLLRHGLLEEGMPLHRPSWEMDSPDELVGTSGGLADEFDRYERILRAATSGFNARGAGASIPRMAAHIGVSKTVVYQYAVDKQDLLSQCYLRCIRVVEASHRLAADFGSDPVDEALIHRTNLYRFHASVAGPFALINAIDYLRPQQQRIIRLRNHGIRATSEQRLRRAIGAGLVRPTIDPRIVQPVIAQALYGLPAWYREDHPLSVPDVAHETGELLFLGLGARR